MPPRRGAGEGAAGEGKAGGASARDDPTQPAGARPPRTGGRAPKEERRRRLEVWGAFIEAELAARGMRPAQLARYANVNASTVSLWRHRKSLPNRQAVLGVARCLRLPVAVVAERAGVLPSAAAHAASRIVSDPEWRVVLASIDRLPDEEFRRLKAALARVVRQALDDTG